MSSSDHQIKTYVENRRKVMLVSLLLWLTLTTGSMFLFPRSDEYRFSEYQLDAVSKNEIIAPFTFDILKNDDELEEEREAAAALVEPVFERIDSLQAIYLSDFELLLRSIKLASDSIQLELLNPASNNDSLLRANRDKFQQRFNLNLPLNSFTNLISLASTSVAKKQKINFSDLITILKDLYARGILDKNKSDIVTPKGMIRFIDEGEEKSEPLERFYEVTDARTVSLNMMRSNWQSVDSTFADSLVRVSYELLLPYISPNVLYNEEETSLRKQRAINKIPLVKGIVFKDERIIDSNERITEVHLEKLRSLEKKRLELETKSSLLASFVPWAGRFLLAGLIYFFIGFWYYNFRKELFVKPRRLILVAVLLAILITFFGVLILPLNISQYLFPAALGTIILTILFDSNIALVFLIGLSLLFGAMTGNNFFTALLTFVPAYAATFAVRRVRTRVQIMRASLLIFAGYVLMILIHRSILYQFDMEIFRELLYAFVNSLATPLLALGMLIAFEWIFGVTSDLTLLELADLNRPLLKRLSLQAPGTYHHSILVGNLAEAAAEAIEANPLLVRAGAYYHDIGKMVQREYFVENQVGVGNIHDTLEPEESAEILRAHVTGGVKIADQHHLPESIKAFILEHHGTGLMAFFYGKALKMRPDGSVKEEQFRYPGPKPQTKETGILMLADTAEAASRSLDSPTPDVIRDTVREVAINKYRDKELDECPLTLRDLRLIIEAFLPILEGIHHHRIKYPSREELKKNTIS